MLPLLLNKAVLSLWPHRSRPPAWPGRRPQKRINLALQGGGAHGAFTWGVLDELLTDTRVAIEGISGTSAGALNAVVLAQGLCRGGREEARQHLADFWRAASFGGHLPDLQRGVVERLFSFIPRPVTALPPWLGAFTQIWSPYDLNPLNINPLEELIERFVDFDLIRTGTNRQLFVSATNVRTGEPRVFSRAEITAEVVMASACLPLLFRAVEIDGEAYWDGGYSTNPALLPFTRTTRTEDLLIVQINPRERTKVPVSASDIMSRTHEITFNAAQSAELRTIGLLNDLIDQGYLPRGRRPGEYRRIRLHRIVMADAGASFDPHTRLNNDFDFFERLHKLGQRAARRFLEVHFDDIGSRSTIDPVAGQAVKVA
ncbi:MAG TPA: patatin-like phospholipase family protein [Xanthobacteraceae bacterium]|jgi:NTE family protein|nr:patatin-like phospholipase family protein [Xanthobacteraceae bacterium]